MSGLARARTVSMLSKRPLSTWPAAAVSAWWASRGPANRPFCAPLPDLFRPGSGDIEIDGAPVLPKRGRAFYKMLQMVFQDPYASLHPRHSVDQVLSETLQLHGFKDIDARVNRLLDDVGLGAAFRFRYPHQLSGGQRQRVAIARALAPEPEILLLDEPTSALDVSVQAEILNLLSDLRAEHKLTFVMVSHDLSVVGHMCDNVAVMRDGEVVEVLGIEKMRRMEPENAYTKHLLDVSLNYASS